MLLHLHSMRQQLLRLVALVTWSPRARVLMEVVDSGKVMDCAAEHSRMLQAAVDDMFEGHMGRAPHFNPMFDVQTAMEVLRTGDNSLG